MGRLLGVRPGRTTVHAEFDGVRSQQPLEVEVTAGLDVDEIRIAPAPITMLPGETVALDAVGYKGGKSVGIITRLARSPGSRARPQIAQVNGSAVTGVATRPDDGHGPAWQYQQPARPGRRGRFDRRRSGGQIPRWSACAWARAFASEPTWRCCAARST